MRTQFVPAARLHRITLVSVVTLLACALVVSTDSRRIIIVNAETSKSVLGVTGPKRRLRARKHQGDEFPESRGLNFNKVPGVANVLQKFSKNPANELEAEQLFLKMNLANAKTTLFENPQFQAWSARVVKGHRTNPEAAQTAIAVTLTKQLGDEALAKMIAAAKEVESTKSMAAQLEQAQLKNWLSKERNANYVFQALKLDKETYSLLWNPLLNTWASYAKMLKADPPMLLFDKLKSQYSDATIANLLASAKRENAAPIIVDDVENLLFDTWMAKRQTGDEIFTLLGLNHRRDRLFNAPEVSTWVSYVTKLNREGADEQIFRTLTKYYNDHEVTVMLVGSKKYLSADVANKLEEMLHSSWLEEATTANKMFAKLKLDNQGGNLFESPAFSSWVRYVTKLDAQNADDLLLAALKMSYTDAALANLLVAARTSDNTRVLADKLAGAQRKDWFGDKKSADDVFKLLKLDDDAVDDLMKSPLLGHWEAYVSQQLRENPYEILLVKLKAQFPDSEGKFADMLMNAKQDASTSVIAGKIEAAQLEKWSGGGKTARDVFKRLGLQEEGVFLLWYRRVRMWAAYVSKVEARNSDEIIASVLKAHLDDYELGTMIAYGRSHDEEMTVKFEELVQKMWLSEGKSADDVFNYVLKRHRQFIFEIPRDLNTWASYVTKLDEEGAYKAMFAVLNRRYDERTLSEMLDKAEDVSDTKLIAEKLEQELWLSKGRTAEDVFHYLNLHWKGHNLFESSVLHKWVSYVARMDKKNADQTLLSVLESNYSKKDLVKLLGTAKSDSQWKDLAARLEQLLAGQ